jgi:hypothetical protein
MVGKVPLLRDVILATVMQARESFAGNQAITHPNSWNFSAYLSMHTVTSPQISRFSTPNKRGFREGSGEHHTTIITAGALLHIPVLPYDANARGVLLSAVGSGEKTVQDYAHKPDIMSQLHVRV